MFFWDKLNKSNYYLELAIQNADLPIDDRLVNHLSNDLISDGGQYDMAVNLLMHYGVVPQSVYPESLHSSLSGPLNNLLKRRLREHALILRRLASHLKDRNVVGVAALSALRVEKEKLMKEIYTVMAATLGAPPSPDGAFTWDYYTQDGKAATWTGTPKQFFESFASKPYHVRFCQACRIIIIANLRYYQPKNNFSLINDPRNSYSTLYTVEKLGNVWGGRPILCESSLSSVRRVLTSPS